MRAHQYLMALVMAMTAVSEVDYDAIEPPACEHTLPVVMHNQTSIDFYKKCTNITTSLFYVDMTFKGPFVLPGVESVSKFVAGLYLPKLGDSNDDPDYTTSISMPDLKNVSAAGISIAYTDNLTSISFPKLTDVTGDVAILDNWGLKNLSLPALTTVTGGVYLEMNIDKIELPSLKNVSYLRIVGGGNINCPSLGEKFANLTFTPEKYDPYSGFTCYTPYENNNWNSSDPDHNPKPGSSDIATYGNQDPDSAARGQGLGLTHIALLLLGLLVT